MAKLDVCEITIALLRLVPTAGSILAILWLSTSF